MRTGRVLLVSTVAWAAWACGNPSAVLTQLVEARRLAAELHVNFTKTTEASNRAVMAITDDTSKAAADEARRAREIVERNVETLRTLLSALGYQEDLGYLDAFKARFDEYRRLDDEVLPLAVENTNLKAQQLSFGAAQQAAESFRTSLQAIPRAGKGECCAEVLTTKALAAVLEIQVLQAPHIAEADDAAMTAIEGKMRASEAQAREALRALGAYSPTSNPQHVAAVAALDRFLTINSEIVALSRRNTNIRSLALSLGRKRTVAAECEDQLSALEGALAKHSFSATR